MRKALVHVKGVPAAVLSEHALSGTPAAYRMEHLPDDAAGAAPRPVSLLPALAQRDSIGDITLTRLD